MYVDARYHIVTLISVFIALAIGLMVGAAVVSKKSLDQRSVEIAEQQRLEAQSEAKRQADENEVLSESLSRTQASEKALFSEAVRGALAGRKVALIDLASIPEKALIDIRKAIEQASGEVVMQAKVRRLFPPGGDTLGALAEKLGLAEEGKDPSVAVVRKAADALIAGTDDAALQHLYESGYIDFQGKIGGAQVAIVLIGGHADSKRGALFDGAFAEAGRSIGATVVGTETKDARYSSMVTFQERGLSTVDNIDEVIGKYSLIRILTGAQGHFGTKDTAERLTPEEPTG
jgi:hypothetical protein